MKQAFLILMALSIVAFAPAGPDSCQRVREEVTLPARRIATFLKTRPRLETLADTACAYLLTELKHLPTGARRIRELGALGVENTRSRCTTAVGSIHYPCMQSAPGEIRCLPETYSYCGQWEYSMTAQPKYELAMELSTEIDFAYDKAQQLCGYAMSGDAAAAESSLKDLEDYLDERVLPQAEQFEGAACSS